MANPAFPDVKLDRDRISVSGLSAGAFMAHQLHIAYSDLFCGAGLIAGGPFMASRGSLWGALAHGLHGMPPPDAAQLVALTESLAQFGSIAPLSNLAHDRVWVFHGQHDSTVKRSVSDALVEYYRPFVHSGNLAYVTQVEVAHGMPIARHGPMPDPSRGKPEPPYLLNCGYDAAGALLEHLHGSLRARQETEDWQLVQFDQRPFLPAHPGLSMDGAAYAYLPKAIGDGRPCGLHVALHGCQQHRGAVGDAFARHAGYNEWAEANDLIVLYPQACSTRSMAAYNPLASWDWWSYTGADYALRGSPQMQAIVRMVEAFDDA